MFGLSSSSIIATWVFIEVNLISFVLILALSSNKEFWTALKYFIIQRFGSIILIFRSLRALISLSLLFSAINVLAIRWKLGIAPFQFWLIEVTKEIPWNLFFVLITLQKILPLYFLKANFHKFLSPLVALGVLVRLWGGLISSGFKRILVYSSILNLSWIIPLTRFSLIILFLVVYSIGLFLITLILGNSNYLSSQNSNFLNNSLSERVIIFIAFIRIIGIPPTAGFLLKLVRVSELIFRSQLIIAALLLLGSAGYIFIYLRICLFKISPYCFEPLLFTQTTNLTPAIACVVLLGGGLLII